MYHTLRYIIKNFILFFLNKKNNVNSFSFNIAFYAKIGKKTVIKEYTEIDNSCDIGKYGFIGRNCHITKTKIGNYCSLANNISIGQGEHDLKRISTSSLFYDYPYAQLTQEKCYIGHDVWIGVDAIILRGVTLGNGVVVGSNSVVTKNIPPYAVVVGSPAKIIKYRFDSKKIKNIESSKWWNYDFIKAKEIIQKLEMDK